MTRQRFTTDGTQGTGSMVVSCHPPNLLALASGVDVSKMPTDAPSLTENRATRADTDSEAEGSAELGADGIASTKPASEVVGSPQRRLREVRVTPWMEGFGVPPAVTGTSTRHTNPSLRAITAVESDAMIAVRDGHQDGSESSGVYSGNSRSEAGRGNVALVGGIDSDNDTASDSSLENM